MLVLQVREWLQILGKSALMRIDRLTNSLAKGLQRMVTEFAVAILKNTRQRSLRISAYGAAEVFIDFAEELEQNSIVLTFGKLVLACATELDTLTTSRSPTTVITADGEVQTHEEATVYVKELDIFLTTKVLEGTPAILSLGKLCDEHGYSYEWINGQKTHLIENGIRIQCTTENFVPIVVPGLSTSSSSSFPTSPPMTPSRQGVDHPASSSSSSTSPTMTSSTVSSESGTRARGVLCGIDSYPVFVSSEHVEKKERGDPLTKPTKNPKPNKNEDHDQEQRDLCHSDIPQWMQEFRENIVDDRVPEHRDSHASSSHEVSLEPTFRRREDLGKHSVYTHSPKDRSCEVCQRTKITRAPCRRRNGGAVLREENFGDLITADHKVLSEGCKSRHHHRYAVVVQDLATQWIQSYPCKTKTPQETKELAKVLGAE